MTWDLDELTCAGCGGPLLGEHAVVLVSRPPRRILLATHPRLACLLDGLREQLEGGLVTVLTRWVP